MEQTHQYIGRIEGILGPKDKRFILRSIDKAPENEKDRPGINFPDGFHYRGNCPIDIYISWDAWDNPNHDQAILQIAHECVHLLDPGKRGTATVLEEGLATWFQCEYTFHHRDMRDYIADFRGYLNKAEEEYLEKYRDARQKVIDCDENLIKAVRELRSRDIRIRDITAEQLAHYLPDGNPDLLEKLCEKF